MPRVVAQGESDLQLARDPLARAARLPSWRRSRPLRARRGTARAGPDAARGLRAVALVAARRETARCRHCAGPLGLPGRAASEPTEPRTAHKARRRRRRAAAGVCVSRAPTGAAPAARAGSGGGGRSRRRTKQRTERWEREDVVESCRCSDAVRAGCAARVICRPEPAAEKTVAERSTRRRCRDASTVYPFVSGCSCASRNDASAVRSCPLATRRGQHTHEGPASATGSV